jgi:DNA-binding HxlR family transcriptional regulator
MELIVDVELILVKSGKELLQDRLWYAVSMSTPEPSPEQMEACATHPMGRALRLLGDAPTLIFTLLHGTRRFGALRTAMADISPKTIAQRLRLLEELGFVRRRAFAEIPPRVEYDLTEKGFALADIMAAIKTFGERYLSDTPLPLSTADQPDAPGAPIHPLKESARANSAQP